jgi:hypothetical protein
MRRSIVGLMVLGLMGCASGGVFGREPDVVIVTDDDRRDPDDRRYPNDRRYPDDRDYPGSRGHGKKLGHYKNGKAYRTVSVPRAYYPQPGACRLWFSGRAARYQPRAMSCDRLYGRVPVGAFILYNHNAWDADYDWYDHERRYRESVPRLIVQISASMRQRR